MQENIKNLTNNIGEILKDRIFSPMYFYFITSWILWNWKFVFTLLFVDQSSLSILKLDYLVNLYKINIWTDYFHNTLFLFFGPALSSFVFMWWFSILSERFYKKYEEHKQNLRVVDRSIAYKEKVVIANEERKIRNIESDKKEIDYNKQKEFNNYLDELQDDVDVFGYKMRPSEVLYNNDYEAYREKLQEWNMQVDTEIDAAGDAYVQQQIDITRGK